MHRGFVLGLARGVLTELRLNTGLTLAYGRRCEDLMFSSASDISRFSICLLIYCVYLGKLVPNPCAFHTA